MIENLLIQLQELCDKHDCQLEYHYDVSFPEQKHYVFLRYPVAYMCSRYESEQGSDLAVCLKAVLDRATQTFTTKQ
jgi:hypothetical protein